MSRPARALVGLVLVMLFIAGGLALLHAGMYGWTIFVLFPVVLGGLAAWVFRPASVARAAGLGALACLK